MRYLNPQFATADGAADKRARFVVMIEFDVGSIYFTSHDDIAGVPGIVVQGVLQDISATSQRIVPDEGRSEIGSMSFSLVDRSSAVTNEFRAKLASSRGLRSKTVRLYRGFEGFAWSEFSLFQTQSIRSAEYDFGAYKIECSDITREQRKEIFAPKVTTLRLSCTDTDTTISVYDTSEFLAVLHGAAWADGPSGEFIYFKIQDEIIRAPLSGKTPDSFTNCARGALNTRPKAHAVDEAVAADQRTKVEEVVYLEGPCAQMAYAILTGVIHGQAGTLPAHWHLGIDPSMVVLSDFLGIGVDLWDTSNPARGFVLRFAQEKAQDGKAFLEKLVYTPMGCFSPVYADGRLGLRRMAALTSDAAAILTLTEDHVVGHSGLTYDMPSLINDFQVDWSYDGKEPRRRSKFVDRASALIHGTATLKKLEWRGVYGAKATDVTIWQRLFAYRDRYSAPPLRLQVQLLSSLSGLEVGDVVRVKVANLRDFAGTGPSIDRSFEVQRLSINHTTGDLDVDLFGSTARPSTTPPADITAYPLPDVFYDSLGTALSSVSGVTITDGVMTAAPVTPLAGNANVNAAGAIYYYLGDLTIQNGVTLKIADNVQLRVMGYLTINGVIDGNYAGLAGVSDSGGVSPYLLGNAGFIGNSRGLDGLRVTEMGGNPQLESQPIPTTKGRFDAFPFLTLEISGNSILGIPSDLRGTGGGPGGKMIYQSSLRKIGGPGGNGGAGLVIISRGGTFGGSGQITLNGADTASPTSHLEQGKNFYPGTGGAGGPGSLLWLMDTGPAIAAPDMTGKFYGVTGSVALPYDSPEFPIFFMPSRSHQRRSRGEQPYAGYLGPEIISGLDLSNAAHRIQYIPPTVVFRDDVNDPPPPLVNMTVVPGPGYNLITVVPPDVPGVTVELYESIDGNPINAVFLQELTGTQFYHALLNQQLRYYHAFVKLVIDANTELLSEVYPKPPATKFGYAGPAIAQDLPEQADFLETFEHQDMLGRYDSVAGSGAISYPTAGSNGGRVLQVSGGSRVFIHRENIPLDPQGFFRMTARLRLTVAPTLSNADGVYIGFRGIAADGVTPVYASGGQDHYPCAANLDTGSATLGTWIVVTGYFMGAQGTVISPAPDINSPSRVAPDIAYIRPLISANYLNGDGVQQFDYLRIERLVAGRWQDIAGDGKPGDYADNTASHAPDVTGGFFESWEHGDWQRYYNNRANAPGLAVSYPNDGQNGGRVIQAAGGQLWLAWKENVPFDPTVLYRITAGIRRRAPSSVAGRERVYVGVEGVAADGVTLINMLGINDSSSQHYMGASNFDLSTVTLDEWTEVSGYFKGHGTPITPAPDIDNPSPLYPGVASFRPLVILNYSDGDGTQECDYLRVERLLGSRWVDVGGAGRPIEMTPDPDIIDGTPGRFWWWSSTGQNVGWSISSAGGLVAGVISLQVPAPDTFSKYLYSNPIEPIKGIQNEWYMVRIRYRRRISVPSADGIYFQIASTASGRDDPVMATAGTSESAYYAKFIGMSDFYCPTQDQWYEATFPLRVDLINATYPYIRLRAWHTTGFNQARHFEIDVLEAVPSAPVFNAGSALQGAGLVPIPSSNSGYLTLGADGTWQERLPMNVVNDQSFTLAIADAYKSIFVSNQSANRTITIPPNSSVAFPIGTVIIILNYGAGSYTLTIARGSGVVLRNSTGTDQNDVSTTGVQRRTITKVGTDTWLLTLG